jgi:glycosyltransferase involved in cell wall biosynthesis
MKIAIIGAKGYPYVYGGYDTFVKELSERLVKRGVDVAVYNHRSLFDEKPAIVNGVRCIYTPAIETKAFTQLSHSLISFLHAAFSSVDIILAVNPANGPFGYIAKLFGKKCLINMDGLEWDRPKWQGIASRYFLFAARVATRSFDLLVNDSEAMRKVYLDRFESDSVMIPYGANIRYSSDPGRINQWGLVPGEYYLIVGRMIPDNNSDLILEAFAQCNTQKKLVIVGDAPFKDEFATQLKERGALDSRVVFTGYVTDQVDLAELYHQSYVYIHGHEYGGTNPAMLKALAYGCAILALRTSFNEEMLLDGSFGRFFRKDKKDICQQIETLDANPDAVTILKSRSREGLTGRYSWDLVTDQYIAAFSKLIKKPLD